MSSQKVQVLDVTRPSTYMTFYTIFQITGISLVCLVYLWIVIFRGGFGVTEAKIIFNWHPLLMTVGFIYLQANSILHYRSYRNNIKRKLKNHHAILHGIVLVLVVLAGCAALISHVYAVPPIPNFYSLHSWLGIVAIVLFLSQFVGGLLLYQFPKTNAKCKEAMLSYHVFFGIFVFVLTIATSVLGFGEKLIFALDKQYKLFPVETFFGNFIGVLCVLYGALVVFMVTKVEFKRSPKLEYEPLL